MTNPTADMRFVRNFTPPDFQAKNFTPSFSPNLTSEGNTEIKKQGNTQKVIEILIHVAVLIAIYGATV